MAAMKRFRAAYMHAGFTPLIVRKLETIVPNVSQVDNSSNFLNNIPHRKHPGILHLKCVKLPPELVQAVSFWVAQSPIRDMEKKSESFSNYLWSRKRPIELKDLRKKAQLLEQKLRKDAEVLVQQKGGSLDESDKLKQKVLTAVRQTTFHWEELKYTKELSFLYMVSRMDANYAAVSRAFHEIQKRVPDFQPKTLLDFGSGTGAVSWAAHSIWGESLKEYMNIDCSVHMLSLAEKLMRGISESQELFFPGIYFRQAFPVGPQLQTFIKVCQGQRTETSSPPEDVHMMIFPTFNWKNHLNYWGWEHFHHFVYMTFDLSVSAFSLNDLPTYAQRIAKVKNLWKKTNNFLVLVENGTKEGHQMLMEARDVILKEADKVKEEAHVFAPCPHHLPCPRMLQDNPLPCNFLQQYEPLPLSWNPPHKTERFSFLILSRGSRKSMEPWPRITQPVLCRKRHIHVHLCCADGTLQHAVVTSKKHSRDLYRCVWNSNCGDRLPILTPNIESILEDKSTLEDQKNDSQKVNTAPCQDQN